MTTPKLTYIKAQCRQLDADKKRELLKFLTEELSREECSINNSSIPCIDEFVTYVPDFISKDDNVLMEGLKADFVSLGLNGTNKKKVCTKWVGDKGYAYGNIKHPALPFKDNKFPFIEELMGKINNDGRWGSVDSCFVAHYPSNLANVGSHTDDEENLDEDSSICTVSVGATRDVEFLPNNKAGTGPRATVLKTITVEDRSMYIMKAGCQQLFRHRVPISLNTKGGERFCLSFRKTKNPDEVINNISSSMPKHYSDEDVSFGNKTIVSPVVEKVSLILGASIIKELDPDRLAKGSNKCYVRAGGGNKLSKISSDLDTFYEEHGQDNVVKVFISAGVNDLRYCTTNGVYHLRYQVINLISKINLYFPHAKVFFQSVLPVYVENRYTVKNILDFNRMLYEICSLKKCYYLNVFGLFLSPWSMRNDHLYSDRVHLNRRGIAILARVYILHINKERFNPII